MRPISGMHLALKNNKKAYTYISISDLILFSIYLHIYYSKFYILPFSICLFSQKVLKMILLNILNDPCKWFNIVSTNLLIHSNFLSVLCTAGSLLFKYFLYLFNSLAKYFNIVKLETAETLFNSLAKYFNIVNEL